MPKADPKDARERRLVRDRSNQMLRAEAAVHMALEGLRPHEQIVVLHEVVEEKCGKRHDSQGRSNVYLIRQPAAR
jgi:hypothetical protein